MQIIQKYRRFFLALAVVTVYVLVYWYGQESSVSQSHYILGWITFSISRIGFFALISLTLAILDKPVATITSTLGFILAIVLGEIVGGHLDNNFSNLEQSMIGYKWLVFVGSFIVFTTAGLIFELDKPIAVIACTLGFILAVVLGETVGGMLDANLSNLEQSVLSYKWLVFIGSFTVIAAAGLVFELNRGARKKRNLAK